MTARPAGIGRAAAMAVTPAGDQCRFMTGAVVVIGGGCTL